MRSSSSNSATSSGALLASSAARSPVPQLCRTLARLKTRPQSGQDQAGTGSILADVLVPHVRMGGDVVAEHADAFGVLKVDHLDAVLAQPVDAAAEVHRFADHHRADVELPHQPAAVPAWCERGDHDRVAVTTLATGLAEGVGLAVHRRVVLLDAAVVAAAEQAPIVVV